MNDLKKDKRFSHITRDPRFRNIPTSERKFQVDKRFKKMFTDQKFKVKYNVDKRGRPMTVTSSDNLKKFYDLPSSKKNKKDDDEEEEPVNEEVKDSKKRKHEEKVEKAEGSDDDDEDNDEETGSEDDDEDEESETESEESSDSGDEDVNLSEIPWNELDKNAPRSENETNRLAVCNIDWDRINSKDLFVLLNSFKPAHGSILSVKIYPSSFGLQRMEDESMKGPTELTGTVVDENDNSEVEEYDDDEEGNNLDTRKLREYQFNRLKYFYAIIECDSIETANQIYKECDGLEYESSSNRLDLRFVSSDEVFETEPRDVCVDAPDPAQYKPNKFFTTALNQTKIKCTWDETPKDRLDITMFKHSVEELDKMNYKNILASSSEDDDDEEEKEVKKTKKTPIDNDDDETEEARIDKYRKLFQSENNESDDDILDISWENDLNKSDFKKKKTDSKSKSKTKKPKLPEDEHEKAELALLASVDDDVKNHFNYDKIVKKKTNKKFKKGDDKDNKDDFKIDLQDPRFEAVFTSHHFNIDPSSQLFKKTDEMEKLIYEKSKRDTKTKVDNLSNLDTNETQVTNGTNSDLSTLVASIKNRSKLKFK